GHRDLPQRGRGARGRGRAAARSHPGGDRLPAARAGAAPRPAQRAGARRARGRGDRGGARDPGRGGGARHRGERAAAVRPAAGGRRRMSARDAETRAIVALAERLAREAGALQRARYETELEIGTKSRPIDLVTEVDRACEALIVEGLRRARPGDDILAEEGGVHAAQGAAWR